MSERQPDTTTTLARVQGLGSARAGTIHFWRQRVTAVALAFLSVWFVVVTLRLVGAPYETVTAAFASPWTAVPMFLFVAAALYHMALGLQVVVEDYVHQEGLKIVFLILVRFFAVAVGAAAFFALVKLALAGT